MGIEAFHRWLALSAAAVALAGVPSCGQAGSPQAGAPAAPSATSEQQSPATPPPAAPRIVKWIDLKAGDCLAAPPSPDPAEVTVTVVDCATPHLAEVFLRADIPVNAAVTGTANPQCEAGLQQYIGTAAGPFTITYLIDSVQDRTFNNPYPSTVICLLQDVGGQALTGSARG